MSDDDTTPRRREIDGATLLSLTRRGFIKATSSSVAAGGFFQLLTSCDGCDDKKDSSPPMLEVVRPDDLLVFRLRFVNLERDGEDLVRGASDDTPLVIVELPRQHVLEEAVLEGMTPKAPPVDTRLSGPSRLVFEVPESVDSIPYSMKGVLDALPGFALRVSPNALPPDPPSKPTTRWPGLSRPGIAIQPDLEIKPDLNASKSLSAGPLVESRRAVTNARSVQLEAPEALPSTMPNIQVDTSPKEPVEPEDDETAIEFPSRVLISPNVHARFAHESEPFGADGWVELWHTRLGTASDHGVDEGDNPARTIRALWVRGQPFDPDDPKAPTDADQTPFRASLTPMERNQIVHQTSNYTLKEPKKTKPARPVPVRVNRLLLTALGGYFDAQGDWTLKENDNLTSWTHRATLGRDHYVRIEAAGFLYPLGHRASLVSITERKIQGARQTAYLWKRYFIIVGEPVKRYDAGATLTNLGPLVRQMPFVSLAVRNPVTPNLDEPANKSAPFVPSINGVPFAFPMQGVDKQGRLIKLDVPCVWIPGDADIEWPTKATTTRSLYNSIAEVSLDGQRMAMAEGGTDNTTFEVQKLKLTSTDLPASEEKSAGYTTPFYPHVAEAELAIEAARDFANATQAIRTKFHASYAQHGFDAKAGKNPGEVFLEVLPTTPLGLDFAARSDKSGGFLAPSLAITGLSRRTGPIGGDPMMAASNKFDAKEFFKGALPKLFGAIPLDDIIDLDQLLDAAPKFVTEALNEVESLLKELERLKQQLDELKAKALALKTKAENAFAKVSEIVSKIGSGDIAWLMGPDGLSSLESQLQSLRTDLKSNKDIPPGLARTALQIIDGLLDVLKAADVLEKALQKFKEAEEMIQTRTVRLEFRPRIKGDPLGIFVPHKPEGSLVLMAEIRAKAVGSKPAGADLVCSLEDFSLNLIGDKDPPFRLQFDRIAFIARAGKKPDVDVQFGGIIFGGPLEFLNTLKEIIPLDGFSDPPALDVSAEGIKASFSLPLPNVAIGVFSLENISISAGFHIPFLGDAISVNFAFCSRENPFTLTVSMLGGGGFFGCELTPAGIRLLEVALEFGASLSVDFGVASGGVSIMAGIYFAIESDDCTLTGYFRLRGEVEVLGIISASIELYMSLTYESATGKVIGHAELTIEVSIFCFSVSVTISAERRFAGSNGDPTFAEVYAPCDPLLPTLECDVVPPWAEYVNAFAA